MGDRLGLIHDQKWRVGTAAEVRSIIAILVLGEPPPESRIGAITLHRHQLSALQRLNEAIDHFNGALLCDEVGMGKTYVALAVARRFSRCLVVAPAALVSMWQSALTATRTDADILTFEALSRTDVEDFRSRRKIDQRKTHRHLKTDRDPNAATVPNVPNAHREDPTRFARDFIIIDEAHHVRNPRTNRYFALEELVRGARVLLLTATPIHNSRDDLVALLSLVLGSRARAMTSRELAQCVIRREHEQLRDSLRIPTIRAVTSHQVGDDPAVVDALMNLPPPVPLRDGGAGGALIGRGLVHQWASSEAALREAVRRRIARAAALCVSLEAGTYPTHEELDTWCYDDGALQLGFAELLSAPSSSPQRLLAGVRAHLDALAGLQSRFGEMGRLDLERADIVSMIRDATPRTRIVAFAQYSATAAMLYRRIAKAGRVAMLTSHGARIAGGSLTRKEAIARFAPVGTGSIPPPPAEVIELLLTTDLLSEGVNLQDAGTIVHLDIPWTAARMEQRVGRVARLGSSHGEVRVHVLHPPASAVAVLGSESSVRRKWNVARRNVGTSATDPLADQSRVTNRESDTRESTPGRIERLRAILEGWRSTTPTSEAMAGRTPTGNTAPGAHEAACDPFPVVATVESDATGFVAAVSLDGEHYLVVSCRDESVSAAIDDQLDVCARQQSLESPTRVEEMSSVFRKIESWSIATRAAAAAGVETSHALKRRQLTTRIDTLIDSAPPHLRRARLSLAARARKVVTGVQCAAVERALGCLLESEISGDDWLAAVAALDARQTNNADIDSGAEHLRVHAVLMLTVKPRRSRSPRDPESP